MSAVPKLRFKQDDGSDFPDWEEIALGDILHERKEYSEKNKGYQHISLTVEGVVPKSERYNRDFLVKDDDSKKYKVTRQGDICYNPANLKFGVIDVNRWGDGIFSPIYVTFEARGALFDYVGYLIKHSSFINKVRRFEQGTVYERQAVHPEHFVQALIKLPSLLEQQKVASFLSSLDKKIDLLRQKKDALELYKKGLMQKIFSQEIRFKQDDGSDFPDWEEVPFGDVVGINSDKRKVPSKFRYIDLESVKGGVLTDPQEISACDAPSRAQRVLRKGDILFQLVRPYQMNNLFFDFDGHFVASTGYAQLRSANNRFVFYLVHFEDFVAEVLKRSTGSNYPAINSNDLKTIQVSLPAVEEQEKIASFLRAIDTKIQKTSSQIEQMETFKKGLLQQMFV